MPSFIKSASSQNDWINDQVSEFCFVGRSNVGKSSLINAMARENIARTSKTPGRTQLVNFFDFGKYRLIDLPGYGYAKGSRNLRQDITKIIDEYLVRRVNLYGVFVVCDANVLMEIDKQMIGYFLTRFTNVYVILNKIDKQNISTYKNNLVKMAKYLNIPSERIILVSVKKNLNIGQITKTISNILKIK
ncbi:MAG: ribosome biogenesis GTP-binding protein YihA/YsxC [Mycoplasmataceae bacterium]|nr:ribosome biogenesis GTP-binding protein YihA/YsxC [Mycoplasmataceae bacterium]